MSSSLFVTSQLDKTVKEYDGATGAFVRVAASGGALEDPLGLAVGPDGKLLVSDGQTNQVKRYDPSTGGYIDVLASTNLAGPEGMTVHGGSLYVTNSNPPRESNSSTSRPGSIPAVSHPRSSMRPHGT